MGNNWIFDSRFGSINRALNLNVLCVSLLAWNQSATQFLYVVSGFLLLCTPHHLLSWLQHEYGLFKQRCLRQPISCLPTWNYKVVNVNEQDGVDNEHSNSAPANEEECCICLAKYKDKEEVRQLSCPQRFHLKCVDKWLRIISFCPLCKQKPRR
ncbi:unnamed protein product [Linum trigynum]|uniref:RING-type domain-containing protein n=1 Tax=Linum trigynum TaxID=586398 RepID=A0AAV2CD21_9ROSI